MVILYSLAQGIPQARTAKRTPGLICYGPFRATEWAGPKLSFNDARPDFTAPGPVPFSRRRSSVVRPSVSTKFTTRSVVPYLWQPALGDISLQDPIG